jgi:hypothetical protein
VISIKFGVGSLRWEDNIRMDLTKIEWEVVDWIHLAQNKDRKRALLNTVLKLLVP